MTDRRLILCARALRASALALGLLWSVSACTKFDTAGALGNGTAALAAGELATAAIHFKSVLQHAPDNADARVGLGKVLLQQGDMGNAIVELGRASGAGAAAKDVAPLLARAYVEAGDLKRVTQTFADAKIDDPEAQAAVWVEVGRAWTGLGDSTKAQAFIDRALQLRPGHAGAGLMQARLQAARGQMDKAAATIDGVIARDARQAEAWHLRGEFHRALGEYPAAMAAHRKVVELKPDYVRSHAAIIMLLMRQGDMAGIERQLVDLEKAAPKHPVTALMLGEAALLRRDYVRARELAQQLLQALPDQPSVLMLAGAVEAAKGSLVQAAAHYGKVVGQNPQMVDARENLAVVQMRAGQLAQALLTLKPLLTLAEPSSRSLGLAGDIHLQQGNFTEAERMYTRAAKIAPDDARLKVSALSTRLVGPGADDAISELRRVAEQSKGLEAEKVLFASHLRRQEHAAALAVIEAMARKQPDDAAMAEMKGIVLLSQGNTAAAKAQYLESFRLDPARIGTLAKVVAIDIGDGDLPGAEARIRQALVKDPKNSALLLLLASARERAGGPIDEMRKLLAEAVQSAPLSVEARSAQIRYLLSKRLYKDALGLAQNASAALPAETAMLDVVADAQYLAGEVEQAALTYHRLITASPSSVEPYMKLAQVYRSLGKGEQAEQALRQALAIQPDNPGAVAQFADLLAGSNRRAAALEFLKVQRSARGTRAETYLIEAALHERLGDPAAAIASLRDGLQRAPDSALASSLYRQLVKRGPEREATQFAEAWLKQHPKDSRLLFDVALRHADLGQWSRAEPLLRTVVEANPRNGLALNALAHAVMAQGAQGALEFARRANEAAPNTPAFMDTLASALSREGKVEEAMALQKRAMQLDSSNLHLRLGLAKLLLASGDKPAARTQLEAIAAQGEGFVRQAEVRALLATL